MTFLELVRYRQSVRRYLPDPIKPELLKRCLEAARLAPSASNSQPWKFVVVDEPELREKVARLTWDRVLTFNKFVSRAPLLVVLVLEKPKVLTRIGAAIKNIEYPLIDIGIAASHFCLQAAEEGLGTCMLGWFREKPIKKLLHIPDSKSIGLIISVGYPPLEYTVREKIRKPYDTVVSRNRYSAQDESSRSMTSG